MSNVKSVVSSVLAGRLAPYTGPVAPGSAVKAHIGHVGNGGIQAHSCGPTFPYYVLGIGQFCVAFDPERGLCGPLRYSYGPAKQDCVGLAAGNQLHLVSLAKAEAAAVAELEACGS